MFRLPLMKVSMKLLKIDIGVSPSTFGIEVDFHEELATPRACGRGFGKGGVGECNAFTKEPRCLACVNLRHASVAQSSCPCP